MYFSLNSARIFFRADKTADEEKEEKENKETSSEGEKTMTMNSENDWGRRLQQKSLSILRTLWHRLQNYAVQGGANI